jgi:hypothetical protein
MRGREREDTGSSTTHRKDPSQAHGAVSYCNLEAQKRLHHDLNCYCVTSSWGCGPRRPSPIDLPFPASLSRCPARLGVRTGRIIPLFHQCRPSPLSLSLSHHAYVVDSPVFPFFLQRNSSYRNRNHTVAMTKFGGDDSLLVKEIGAEMASSHIFKEKFCPFLCYIGV